MLQDQLNEAKQKVEELEAHPSSGNDEELAQELKDSRQEVANLRQKIVELETNLNEMQTEFQHEKDQLQDMAAEHKTLYEKVDHDLEVLQEEYENLNKELDEKQEEIESYQEQLQKAGGVDAVEFQRLKIQVKDLQNEIHQVNVEKEYLEDQIESLKRDASQLLEKDGRVARERSEERKNLQNVTELSCKSDVQEIENLQQRLKDAQDQKTLIQQQLEAYIAEDDDGDEKVFYLLNYTHSRYKKLFEQNQIVINSKFLPSNDKSQNSQPKSKKDANSTTTSNPKSTLSTKKFEPINLFRTPLTRTYVKCGTGSPMEVVIPSISGNSNLRMANSRFKLPLCKVVWMLFLRNEIVWLLRSWICRQNSITPVLLPRNTMIWRNNLDP